MVEENCNRFFRRSIGESTGQVITPELHPQGAHSGIGYEVWYSGELDVESPD